jgi:hypothetical protein
VPSTCSSKRRPVTSTLSAFVIRRLARTSPCASGTLMPNSDTLPLASTGSDLTSSEAASRATVMSGSGSHPPYEKHPGNSAAEADNSSRRVFIGSFLCIETTPPLAPGGAGGRGGAGSSIWRGGDYWPSWKEPSATSSSSTAGVALVPNTDSAEACALTAVA